MNLDADYPKDSPKLSHFGNFDFTKRYEASAILTEHDIEARNLATREMRTNPEFAHFVYGEASYFIKWEEQVRKFHEYLVQERGPARHTYDGATGLPLLSIYASDVYNENRRRKRRHSLVTTGLVEPEHLR